jgi:hypothetical protein
VVVDLESVKRAMVFSEFVEGSVENSNLSKNTPIFLFLFKIIVYTMSWIFLVQDWYAVAKHAAFL